MDWMLGLSTDGYIAYKETCLQIFYWNCGVLADRNVRCTCKSANVICGL